VNDTMSLSQRADALEAKMARELDYIVIKSRLYSHQCRLFRALPVDAGRRPSRRARSDFPS
jgi:hypothetical protein